MLKSAFLNRVGPFCASTAALASNLFNEVAQRAGYPGRCQFTHKVIKNYLASKRFALVIKGIVRVILNVLFISFVECRPSFENE